MIASVVTLTPVEASNSNSLNLFSITGSKTAPVPFPPNIETDFTDFTGISFSSNKTEWTVPAMTGLTNAVVPPTSVGASISILGGYTASYPEPPSETITSLSGP